MNEKEELKRYPLAVWFNKQECEGFEELKDKNIISQEHKDFVKSAYFEKITQLKLLLKDKKK